MAISSLTAIMVAAVLISSGIFATLVDLFENTGVEERMLEYRAQEFATSLAVISSYDDERFFEMEKDFGKVYTFNISNSGGKENLSIKTQPPENNRINLEIPADEPIPSKNFVNNTVCINKSSGGGVDIYEGSC